MSHPAKLSIERPEKLGRGILILRLFFRWTLLEIPNST
jgi:hypothetical protein